MATLRVRNFGFKSCAANEESGILFDWDRSIISHPFFDLHAYKHVDNNALQAALDDYLRQWTKYESLERVRQCFEMSHIFGFLLCAYHAATQIEAGAMDSINMFAPYFGSNVSVAVTLFEKMNESLVPTTHARLSSLYDNITNCAARVVDSDELNVIYENLKQTDKWITVLPTTKALERGEFKVKFLLLSIAYNFEQVAAASTAYIRALLGCVVANKAITSLSIVEGDGTISSD
eukprot:IDg1114t1